MAHIEAKIQVPVDANARITAALTLQESVNRIVARAVDEIREFASVRFDIRLLARDLELPEHADAVLPPKPQAAKRPIQDRPQA